MLRKSSLLVCVLLTVSACGKLPLKQKAVASLQASELALEGSHDAERILCSPTSDQSKPIQHCDSPTAATVGLTDARHQQLAELYAKAFDVQIKAAVALRTWRAGDPMPTTVAEYQQVLNEILTLVGQTIPKTQETVEKAKKAVDEAAKVAALVGVQ